MAVAICAAMAAVRGCPESKGDVLVLLNLPSLSLPEIHAFRYETALANRVVALSVRFSCISCISGASIGRILMLVCFASSLVLVLLHGFVLLVVLAPRCGSI